VGRLGGGRGERGGVSNRGRGEERKEETCNKDCVAAESEALAEVRR